MRLLEIDCTSSPAQIRVAWPLRALSDLDGGRRGEVDSTARAAQDLRPRGLGFITAFSGEKYLGKDLGNNLTNAIMN